MSGATLKKTVPTTARPWRVAIDTPVVLDALIRNQGPGVWLRQSWQAGHITPLLCTAMARELVQALAWPHWELAPEECQDLLADFLPHVEVVNVLETTTTRSGRASRDRALAALVRAGQPDVVLQNLANEVGAQELTRPPAIRQRGLKTWSVEDLMAALATRA
ncbi:PIN domain-containing protein [Ideonella margarita]|uniref:PIN domain-containing protein n=1 Tax=Ideonella margarita TaxID=2984191 RepID=A0ABU9C7S4_9BURK